MSSSQIKKHLDQFDLVVLGRRLSGDKVARLRSVEAALGARLPRDYRAFMLEFNTPLLFGKEAGYRPIKPSPWDTDGIGQIEMLFGLHGKRGLAAIWKSYQGRIPDSLVAIGESPGGNLICLGIRNDEKSNVYFWDHEDERQLTGNRRHDFGNLYLIVKGFRAFLTSLFLLDSEIDDSDLDDIEMNLDADLIASIDEFKKRVRKNR